MAMPTDSSPLAEEGETTMTQLHSFWRSLWARTDYGIKGTMAEVLARGYAQSKEEYLVLFPGACKTCCCREFRVRRSYAYYEETHHWMGGDIVWSEERTCKRCSQCTTSGVRESGYVGPLDPREYDERVPGGRDKDLALYLSLGVENQFPDFDCRTRIMETSVPAPR